MAIRILYLFLILLFTSCEELEVDEGSIFEADPNQQIPDVTHLDVNINGSSADFSWGGNDFALEFRYMVEYYVDADDQVWQPYNNWSDWTTEKNMGFYNLDEGDYTFYVKSRFGNIEELEDQEPYESKDFEIDAISGPALRIYPLNQTAQYGDEIDVYLYFEEVPEESAVTGLHVDIQINTDELEFISEYYDQGELLKQFGGQTIWPEPGYSDDNSTMIINGVADSDGLYGTGPIIKFSLRVLTSGSRTTNINIISADDSFLNKDGEPIEFGDPVSGSVMVEEAGQ